MKVKVLKSDVYEAMMSKLYKVKQSKNFYGCDKIEDVELRLSTLHLSLNTEVTANGIKTEKYYQIVDEIKKYEKLSLLMKAVSMIGIGNVLELSYNEFHTIFKDDFGG